LAQSGHHDALIHVNPKNALPSLLLTQSGQRHFYLFFAAACSVTKLVKGRRTRLHNVAEDCLLTNSFAGEI